jgi:hypothetical protein
MTASAYAGRMRRRRWPSSAARPAAAAALGRLVSRAKPPLICIFRPQYVPKRKYTGCDPAATASGLRQHCGRETLLKSKPVTPNGRQSSTARAYATGLAYTKPYARAATASRALGPAFVFVLVAFAIALELAREAAVSAWGTVWAEDGSVFLKDALDEPFLSTLVQPYGG